MEVIKWHVEEVYTPDDHDRTRTRKYGEFEAPRGLPVKEIALLGMMSVGLTREWAAWNLQQEADLAGTTIEDGKFDFQVAANTGNFLYVMSKTPIERPAAWVAMVNNTPVAVRPWDIHAHELKTIAEGLKLPVEAFTVVKVSDMVG